jgi:hypothetical protein
MKKTLENNIIFIKVLGKFNLKILLILFYLLFLDQEKSKINNTYRN